MVPTHLLFRAATRGIVHPGPHICLLCGCPCIDTVPVEKVIRDTFTDHGICRGKSSDRVCSACGYYFNHRWATGQKRETEYRKHSMVVAPDAFCSWQRADMRGDIERLLRDGTAEETLLVVALSKKKHLVPLPRCTITAAGQRTLFVQVEMESATVAPASYAAARAAFDALLALGCRKGEILSGDYHPLTLRKVPLVEVLAWERKIAPWRGSGLLTLISYITILEDADDDASAAAE